MKLSYVACCVTTPLITDRVLWSCRCCLVRQRQLNFSTKVLHCSTLSRLTYQKGCYVFHDVLYYILVLLMVAELTHLNAQKNIFLTRAIKQHSDRRQFGRLSLDVCHTVPILQHNHLTVRLHTVNRLPG
jgi:hypothetical protein